MTNLKRALAVLTIITLAGLCEGRARADMELLSNPGFESGALSPWFENRNFGGPADWSVTSAVSHSGTFSATDNGNKELQQNITPTAGSLITNVSFWAEHPDASITALAVVLRYTDGTLDQFIVNTSGTGFNFFNVTSDVDTTKILSAFSIFGNSGGITYFDDASITTAAVPEPSSLAMMGVGLAVCLGAAARRLRAGRASTTA